MNSTVDRRTRKEQRVFDTGPPRGCFERRRRPERRLPTAEESSISDAEWERYFGSSRAVCASSTSDAMHDHAADVLDKVRDRY